SAAPTSSPASRDFVQPTSAAATTAEPVRNERRERSMLFDEDAFEAPTRGLWRTPRPRRRSREHDAFRLAAFGRRRRRRERIRRQADVFLAACRGAARRGAASTERAAGAHGRRRRGRVRHHGRVDARRPSGIAVSDKTPPWLTVDRNRLRAVYTAHDEL